MTLVQRFWHIFLVLTLFWGCRKPTTANWDVDVIIPVVNSSLNIRNFVGDTLFTKDNTGLLHFSYNREIAALKMDSLLKIPDTTITKSFLNDFWLPITLKPGDSIPIPASDLKFDFGNGMSLKQTDIRSGTLLVKFSNDVTQPMDLEYKLPGTTKNGLPFVIKETIPPGKNSLIKTYKMDGYSMNLQGANGTRYNTISQTFKLSLNPSAQQVDVPPNKGAAVEVTYTELVPEFVLGYFGQQLVDIPTDTTFTDFNKNFKASEFMLSEATLKFTIVNEFGVDFSGNISNVKSINTIASKTLSLINDQLATININRASRSGTTLFPTTKVLTFNNSNSNIAAFISNLPNKICYGGEIKMNPVPPGNISGYNDFAFYNTGIRILADIDIPMRFSANYFELSSDAGVDFSTTTQLDKVKQGRFVIYAQNGFPFSAQLQGYMYDAQNNLLDSIFIAGANTIDRGQLNADNIVISRGKTTLYIPVDLAKIANLKKTTRIKVRSLLLMPPNPPEIKLMDTYTLDIKIVAEVNYNVGLNSN
ncbi:MAG: hypothetical protein PSX36_09295 [bacterium]|nr:hypothetical protein [bacterium]